MDTSLDLAPLVPSLLTLVEAAGHCVADFYQLEMEVFEKTDGTPVTRADEQSHFLLTKGLESLLPDVPVISEEDPTSWELTSSLYWLIDPLDGTAGFIQKNGEFCINIALLEGNRPIFGLIHIPLSQETYYGFEGHAWHYSAGKATPIHTRSIPPEGMTLLIADPRELKKAHVNDFLSAYPVATIQTLRSAIKFCSIAAGKADLYLRFEKCAEWDTAAGQALVEAAGGVMVNLDGSPFTYGKPQLLNEEFVVFGEKSAPLFHA